MWDSRNIVGYVKHEDGDYTAVCEDCANEVDVSGCEWKLVLDFTIQHGEYECSECGADLYGPPDDEDDEEDEDDDCGDPYQVAGVLDYIEPPRGTLVRLPDGTWGVEWEG